jgi:phosphatidylserine decarboxylase
MFHKEGFKIILITFTLCIGLSLLANNYLDNSILRISIIVSLIAILVLILQFFRNPKRNFIMNNSQVLSPVDGKVVVIEEVFEKKF